MDDGGRVTAALAALVAGRSVAAATETFFGLLADATKPAAIGALLSLKARGQEKGMPLILPDRDDWRRWAADIPRLAQALADEFWPGPLTIALEARSSVDARLLLDGKIAVRLPAASDAASLAARLGRALTATSANTPGMPPASESDEVSRAFADAVANGALHVLAGKAPGGAPSTVVVIDGNELRVARIGAISAERIAAFASAKPK